MGGDILIFEIPYVMDASAKIVQQTSVTCDLFEVTDLR